MLSPKKNIYIDIDGVLLTAKNIKPAEYAIEFIDFITSNFNCFWLTTHCKGDAKQTFKYLSSYFDDDTIKKLEIIKPTNWTTLKTEAIDFSTDFFWVDDFPFLAEKNILISNQCLDKLIIVNINQSDELKRVINLLNNLHS